MTALSPPHLRIATAPCSFGVDEVMFDDIWMPGPDEMLDWMLGIGYDGTEQGPPGFLGEPAVARERLAARELPLVGAFLPQHFSRSECVEEDHAWLRAQLRALRESTPEGSHPFAVLCEGIDEDVRRRWSGRTEQHPETQLSEARWRDLVDNLHRAAELCRSEGFDAVLHPHAGTYLETAAEIDRVARAMDPSLVGLCLDTGHFRFGGADPAQCLRDYRNVVQHVHIKDARMAILEQVKAEGAGLEAALRRGVFCPLGEGDSDIPGVVAALREIDYRGWIVVEQDQFLDEDDTRASVVATQRLNLAYLRGLGL